MEIQSTTSIYAASDLAGKKAKKTKAEDSFSQLLAAATGNASSAAARSGAAASQPSTTVNLHSATLGQVLTASQELGLGKVSGYLETMSTDTDGSSATAHVFEDPTKYDIPKLLDQWADFDSSHGAEQGAQQIRAIKDALLSHADENGNMTYGNSGNG